ncbi:Uncharacterized protein HZ326_21741 [Fusarium oxysporum f. sp. albedinis]|nr:Uncharacterized protein HZ326_21741 [Fusarium oxysporum f. sp. albedinis]
MSRARITTIVNNFTVAMNSKSQAASCSLDDRQIEKEHKGPTLRPVSVSGLGMESPGLRRRTVRTTTIGSLASSIIQFLSPFYRFSTWFLKVLASLLVLLVLPVIPYRLLCKHLVWFGLTPHTRPYQTIPITAPWTTRIRHSTSPWREDTDKTALDDSLESMIYWNNTLYSILPQNIRDSILELGIAGYALDSPENIKDIVNLSNNRNGTLSQSAKLMTIRRRFKDGSDLSVDLDAILQKMELKEAAFEGLVAADVFKGCQYTISQYASQDGQISRVLIEWIPIPKDFGAYKLAHSRMAQISWTLQQIGTFSAIQAYPALGFVEFGSARSFGLVSTLPRSFTSSTKVYTLYDMLSGGQKSAAGSKSASRVQHALPSLNQRLQLASKLAMGFYTFLLTRWHHERFNSLHIAFLTDERDAKSKTLDLTQPIIGGFAISRPDSPTELSISASVEDTEVVYLHPDIRKRLKSGSKQNGDEQRFQRVHDIYTVGLLLAEIGYWRPIAKVAESGSKGSKADSMSPEQFKEAVVKKCKSDLAFFAGETYRDITLRCLLAGESGGVQAENDAAGLNNLYWDVGISLMTS